MRHVVGEPEPGLREASGEAASGNVEYSLLLARDLFFSRTGRRGGGDDIFGEVAEQKELVQEKVSKHGGAKVFKNTVE